MFWLWISLAGLLLFLLYRWSTENYHVFDGYPIKVKKPYPLLGSNPGFWFKRTSIMEVCQKFYKKYGELPYHAGFDFKDPIVTVNDLDIIKNVFIKHFDHFENRRVFDAFLEAHPEQKKFITNLKGEEWKLLRNSLSPCFTTGKLKHVIQALDSCGPEFTDYVRREVKKSESGAIQMKETFKRYTMSAIARGVFGIDAKAFEEEDSEFVKNAKNTQFKFNWKFLFGFFFFVLFPSVAKFFKLRLVKKITFFSDLTRYAMDARRQMSGRQNDMLQLLLDLKEEGEKGKQDKAATDTSEEAEEEEGGDAHHRFEADAKLKGMTKKAVIDEETVTQSAVLFLIAGFDTTALSLSMVAYHLATNPEAQERARQEADDVAASLGEDGRISYDDVKRMEYLEMVVNESMRLTPIAAAIERVCSKEYKLPCGTVIAKDVRVMANMAGVHTDPKYWDDPEKFRPERFGKEERHKVVHGAFLPFGLGPRNCIGMRFAMMEVKLALYHLLRHFVLEPCEKTPIPARYNKDNFMTEIVDGNWLKVTPRVGEWIDAQGE